VQLRCGFFKCASFWLLNFQRSNLSEEMIAHICVYEKQISGPMVTSPVHSGNVNLAIGNFENKDNGWKKPQPGSRFPIKSQKAHFGQMKERGRANTVRTKSGNFLPVAPRIPKVVQMWHYVDENENTHGQVTEAQLRSWCKKVGMQYAAESYVWNGNDVKQWTVMEDLPELVQRMNSASDEFVE